MATAAKLVFSHITKNPGVCGGKACIDSTRIRVIDIVQLERQGKRPEEMRDVFAIRLSLAQIYSALAYADENPQEIATDLAEEDNWEEQHDQAKAEYLSRRQNT